MHPISSNARMTHVYLQVYDVTVTTIVLLKMMRRIVKNMQAWTAQMKNSNAETMMFASQLSWSATVAITAWMAATKQLDAKHSKVNALVSFVKMDIA